MKKELEADEHVDVCMTRQRDVIVACAVQQYTTASRLHTCSADRPHTYTT
jgi:hypothetical protein